MKTLHRTTAISVLCLVTLGQGAVAADSPGKLRAEMTRLEKQFIDLYNKVNTIPEFAIACRMETPTGSTFSRRICQPKYIVSANARTAGERMQPGVRTGVNAGAALSKGPNVGVGVSPGDGAAGAAKEQAFQQNMLDVMQRSPELQALGSQRDELQARYERATRRDGDG